MLSFTLPKICLFIFYFVLLIKAEKSSKNKRDILISLFKNPGWKNLNDVHKVSLRKKDYFLEKIIDTSNINIDNTNTKVRAATLILSCSYANDLKMIFFILQHFCDACENLPGKDNDITIKFNCLMRLVKSIENLKLLATLLKGTLYLLDLLHVYRWNTAKKTDFFFNYLLIKLTEVQKILEAHPPSTTESMKNLLSLGVIDVFVKDIESNIDKHINLYCKLVPHDLDSLWKNFNDEYKQTVVIIKKLQFFDFLSTKLNMKMNSIFLEKYFNLGFFYDANTQKMSIPTRYYDTEIACFSTMFEYESHYGIQTQFDIEAETLNKSKTEEIPEFINLIEKEEKYSASSQNNSIKEGLHPDDALTEKNVEFIEIDENKTKYFKFFY
ncbi:uncharacterized protein LOC126906889 [Daktulosphaira vitifoliae]|uniref:uncharacterized protein LOC126906889 n=1 Tax=Daktulosphaira vitifoliae TaxID=58002 RepID=UPI0021AA819A|nr:uncharacterized protein LOC126906889 [Daktulosphaira vitifoliae]